MFNLGRREGTGATEAIADPRAIRAAEATVAARVLLPAMAGPVAAPIARRVRRAMVEAAVVDIHPAVAVADVRPVAVAAAVAAIRLVAIAKAGIR